MGSIASGFDARLGGLALLEFATLPLFAFLKGWWLIVPGVLLFLKTALLVNVLRRLATRDEGEAH